MDSNKDLEKADPAQFNDDYTPKTPPPATTPQIDHFLLTRTQEAVLETCTIILIFLLGIFTVLWFVAVVYDSMQARKYGMAYWNARTSAEMDEHDYLVYYAGS